MNGIVLHDVLHEWIQFSASLKRWAFNSQNCLGRWPRSFRGHIGVGSLQGPVDPVGDLCPSASGCRIGEDPWIRSV